jgi:hypothetical protein
MQRISDRVRWFRTLTERSPCESGDFVIEGISGRVGSMSEVRSPSGPSFPSRASKVSLESLQAGDDVSGIDDRIN